MQWRLTVDAVFRTGRSGPSAPAAEDKGLARLPGDQGCRNAEDIGIAADSEPLDLFSVTECHGQLCRGIREKSGDGDSLWVRQAHRVRPSRPPSRPGAGEAACRGPTSPSPRAAWEATHRRGPDLARKFGATSERARGTDCTRRQARIRDRCRSPRRLSNHRFEAPSPNRFN